MTNLTILYMIGFSALWGMISPAAILICPALYDKTFSEYFSSKRKSLYLLKLIFEGPFVFLRFKKSK